MSTLTDVFLRHYRELLGFLSARTGSHDVAQDCAQDIWLKLHEFSDRTQPSNPRAYIFRVAANIASDWHRMRLRDTDLNLRYDASRLAHLVSDTCEVAVAQQMLHHLEHALLAQPQRSVRIFIMHRHEGLSYRSIAAHIGISVSAVEKHITRVLLTCERILRA